MLKNEPTKEYLEQEYSIKKRSKAEIARELGTSVRTLNLRLERFSILSNCAEEKVSKTVDLTGKRFGRLLVVRKSGTNDRFGKVKWICKCDCGSSVTVNAASLLRGLTKSCNCLKKEMARAGGYKEISKSFYRRFCKSAAERGVEFSISMEYIWSVYEAQGKVCALSGIPISFCVDSNKPENRSASIDRINSALGYVEGNIQIVHKSLNFAKGFLGQEEFIAFCNLVARRHERDHETCIKNVYRPLYKKV